MSRTANVLIAAALAVGGCNAAAYMLHQGVKVFGPEAKVEAEFPLAHRSVLVLVDTAAPTLGSEFPRMEMALADGIGEVLAENRGCGPRVPARSIENVRRAEPAFDRWAVAEVGRYFNVDYVVHVVVHEFRVRETEVSTYLEGYAETTLRVVSPQTGEQAWPPMASARQVTARTLPGDEIIEDPVELERILTEGLADKIARHFFTYEEDSLPLRPKVR